MNVANKAVVMLLKHLTNKDRFGLISFNESGQIVQKLDSIANISEEKLEKTILNIQAGGGTNFECGYNQAIDLYNNLEELKENCSEEYDNRILILTDAQPNHSSDGKCLLNLISTHALNEKRRIYTTIIGVGLDFNSNLVEKITNTRGCNYYTVKSNESFMKKMDKEFEHMVTPLVFNVLLKLNCEGNSISIEKVYGSSNDEENNIIKNGEVIKISTLFPAPRSEEEGGTAGGIQLIKFKRNSNGNDHINVNVIVTFEDRNGKEYKNEQCVTFEIPKTYKNHVFNNDMIESDDEEEKEDDFDVNFYDNNGIRKAILLCKYASLMISWISTVNMAGTPLQIDGLHKNKFVDFLDHFQKEMKLCGDKSLDKEVKIMKKK
eukprot:484466_1